MNQESPIDGLVPAEDLAEALKGDRFKQFLDKIPISILLASISSNDRIIYANAQFETLTGRPARMEGKGWSALEGRCKDRESTLEEAIAEGRDHIGIVIFDRPDSDPILADAYLSVIEDDDGNPVYRLLALIGLGTIEQAEREALEQALHEKDVLLRELQHRVKNNLQIVTALIRLEARNWPDGIEALKRIAGRVEALQILYQALSPAGRVQEVDLGAYLGQVAAGVMRSHASEGIKLSFEADVSPVSINIAMPAGLVVNELMTNALKHAFAGREGGTITVQSLPDETGGRRISVSDDGVGMPEDFVWPQPGRLSTLIVQTFEENAKARMETESAPGQGTRVTLRF
jgi:two-component sensor histidine kinase